MPLRSKTSAALLCFFLPLLSFSCTREGAPPESAPQRTLQAAIQRSDDRSVDIRITPAFADKRATLTVVASTAITDIRWLVNGGEWRDADQRSFILTGCSRGDTVQAKALIGDKEVLSNTVTIANALPEIRSAKLSPEVFKPGEALGVDVTVFDADNDPVTLTYEWKKNGAPAGTGERLRELLKRGDIFLVTITPFDGIDRGLPVIIEREIRNQPPIIEQHNEYQFKDPVYTYQVRATDPDDDTLTYSLGSPVPGMLIESATGLVTWTVPKEFKGAQSVEVVVNDGNGGTAKYAFQITLK